MSPRNRSETKLLLRSRVESGYLLVSIDLLVPLSEGSTLKNVVMILCVGSGLMGG